VPYRGYDLKEITLVPRPQHLPVECWQPIQGGSMRALEFMAKHGIQGMVGGGSAEGGIATKLVNDWIAAHKKIANIDIIPGERLAIGFQFHIAKSREDGIREAHKYYEENMKMFGELRLARALSEEQVVAMRDPKTAVHAKLPTLDDAVRNGGFLTGSPAEIVDQLKALEKRLPGLKRITVNQPLSLPGSMALEQLEWFAKDVMPAFKG
jgi:alkanesulfonate monooxygenase SsuD/methylene tetrahydromethanopterin reductase-like flavin-dependent oxidoreductase (luciferase family)